MALPWILIQYGTDGVVPAVPADNGGPPPWGLIGYGTNGDAPPPPPTPPTFVPQGGSGGGARWERISSSPGAKPGQLSVKEQNRKELRELEEIGREIARQEQITAQNAELSDLDLEDIQEIRALLADAKKGPERITAMAEAFARAGLVLPSEELNDDDDEEAILLILMATLH